MLVAPSMLVSFVAASTLLELTPGPNMTYLAMISATHGRRAGFSAVVGVAIGLLLLGLAGAAGVAVIVARSSAAYELLRWCGIGYLLWLAWEGWRGVDTEGGAGTGNSIDHRTFLWRGLMTNLLNPKAALFYITVLPTFTDPSTAVLGQTIVLSVVYVCVATAIHVTIVSIAGAAQSFLDHPARMGHVRRAMSVGLALVALWFAYSTARPA